MEIPRWMHEDNRGTPRKMRSHDGEFLWWTNGVCLLRLPADDPWSGGRMRTREADAIRTFLSAATEIAAVGEESTFGGNVRRIDLQAIGCAWIDRRYYRSIVRLYGPDLVWHCQPGEPMGPVVASIPSGDNGWSGPVAVVQPIRGDGSPAGTVATPTPRKSETRRRNAVRMADVFVGGYYMAKISGELAPVAVVAIVETTDRRGRKVRKVQLRHAHHDGRVLPKLRSAAALRPYQAA